jgi:hypothetical protein
MLIFVYSQGEGIDLVYRGVPLPGGATNLASVMKQFEREQRRDELERRHAHLAKVYPTLYAGEGDEQGNAEAVDAAAREGGDADAAGVRGTRNLFRKEFGHLTAAAQDRFKEDSLWMGQAENVLRCAPPPPVLRTACATKSHDVTLLTTLPVVEVMRQHGCGLKCGVGCPRDLT